MSQILNPSQASSPFSDETQVSSHVTEVRLEPKSQTGVPTSSTSHFISFNPQVVVVTRRYVPELLFSNAPNLYAKLS